MNKQAEYPDVTLAVIAGGRGRRLGGVTKGLVEVEGQPVLERVLALAPLFADVLLVTSEPAPYARWAVRVEADVMPERGAPGGVFTALLRARTPWILAVACDMPFVTSRVVRVLLGARESGAEAVAFCVEGQAEPLLALYRQQLAWTFGEALEVEQPSLRELLRRSRARLLPEWALRAVDPELRAVVSLNTLEDVERHGARVPLAARRGTE